MDSAIAAIPPFRSDGYLPDGLYVASEAEVLFHFDVASRRRRQLALRLRHWIHLGREIRCQRFLVDGSFVTAKKNPDDVDAVMLLPPDFAELIESGHEAAAELEEMFLTRRPEEIFAAEDDRDWTEWVEFFSRTRENDGRRKGLVEVKL